MAHASPEWYSKSEAFGKIAAASDAFDDYERHLDNGHVTLSSTGSSGLGGAITAALFLRRFAGDDSNWAHIDLMAWNLNNRPGRPRGGEAMSLRAIFHYIEQLAADARDQ